jgi:Ca-activated chloride channel homolog
MMINFWVFFLTMPPLILAFLFWKKRAEKVPTIPITTFSPSFEKRTVRARLAEKIPYAFWIALFSLAFALTDPEIEKNTMSVFTQKEHPREGIALYYILDQSGSMQEKVSVETGDSSEQVPKIEVAINAIKTSLQERDQDLVGLIAFARAARVLCPLTLDRNELLQKLQAIKPLQEDAVNGTAIGYALFKAVNIFVATSYFEEKQKEKNKPVYEIKSRAIIVITDGLQSPHPDDRQNPFRFMPVHEAIRYAKENKVRVYFIGVDPIFKKSEFRTDVEEIKAAVESTGGDFFITSQAVTIDEVLSKINLLEKSALPPKSITSHVVSLTGFFLFLSLFFLGLGTLLETLFCRRVP